MASNAVIGGEGNGGVIDPRVGFVRDSFVAMALILDLMATTGEPLSALVDGAPAVRDGQGPVSTADHGRQPRPIPAACSIASPRSIPRRPRPTAATASGSTGPTAGRTSGRATPSRSSA